MLEKRLEMLEEQLSEINDYNNVLYSQVLGVDYDTTEFEYYRNDSAKEVFYSLDSVFSQLDERSIYAAEMLALELERIKETSNLFKNNKNVILYYPTISPIKTKDFIELTSPYGMRKHPISGEYAMHEGIDISANVGSKIYSTAQGRVVEITYSKYGYGNKVVIQHGYGFETLYAHMDIIYVKRGQWVRKDQLIGTVGNTGRSTGPHLHYEIRKNGELRDPLGYFYTHITEQYLAMK
jgi:murein DD-endopeptidase MepM/ murein hydrolase activator NlpD